MTLRDWVAVVLLVIIAIAATHFYDAHYAKQAASSAAEIVYKTQLEQCEAVNPTRAIQRKYFATVAKGRATSAQHTDAHRPVQRVVDEEIAKVAHAAAAAYVNRLGASPSGELDCSAVTKEP